MSKPSHGELHDRIAAVERRLERRRARMLEDAREAQGAATRTATKMLPIAAAVTAGLAALYFVRRKAEPPRYSEYRARYAEAPRRGLRWAQIAGILGTALRIGTSPQARAFWQGFQRARRGRGERPY